MSEDRLLGLPIIVSNTPMTTVTTPKNTVTISREMWEAATAELCHLRTRVRLLEGDNAKLVETQHELHIARRAIAELFRQATLIKMAEADAKKPADEVQAHVDAVLGDLAKDKIKPQQVEQLQRAITDATLRRAIGGRARLEPQWR